MKRIPPSKRMHKELREVLEEGVMGRVLLSEFLRKGMQLVMQELLEAEVTEFLQREHFDQE